MDTTVEFMENPKYKPFLGLMSEVQNRINSIDSTLALYSDMSVLYDITESMKITHLKKDHDYCPDDQYLYNLRSSEAFGIPAWVGTLVRMGDKKNRCESAILSDRVLLVDTESIADTLQDFSIYALLCAVLYQEYTNDESEINTFKDLCIDLSVNCLYLLVSANKTYWQLIADSMESLRLIALKAMTR